MVVAGAPSSAVRRPGSQAMSGSQKVLALVILALLVVSVVVFYLVIPPSPKYDERFGACYALVPDERKAGLAVEYETDGAAVVGLKTEIAKANQPTPEQLAAFIQCMDKILGADKVQLSNLVRLPHEPLGQVANRWARETGIKLALVPSVAASVNLLRIGPTVGTKAEVLTQWCAALSACVSCDPAAPTDDTPQVAVSLRPDAPALRTVEMPSASGDPWPIPPKDPATGASKAEPWQDIDNKGRRYYRECTPVQ